RRPVILVLAYYQCPRLCTLVLNGLVQGMLEMSFDAGKEFEVVTVSFDPRETWDLAATKKESYLLRYGRPGAEAGWHFLTRGEAVAGCRCWRCARSVGDYLAVSADNRDRPSKIEPRGRLQRERRHDC